MTHRIRHQILEIELPREAGAVALQRRASRVFQEQVLPQLDEAFSRIAPEGRHIRIGRLELDLGDITEANWERDFVEKCVEQISRQVAEVAFMVAGEHPAETISAEENAVAVFRYFLETGTLPWYAKELTLTVLEQMLHKQGVMDNPVFQQETHRILKQNAGVLQRMVWQFSTGFSEKIVEAALGLPTGWVQQAIQIRQSQTGQKLTGRARVFFYENLLSRDRSILKNTPPEPHLLAQIFLEETPNSPEPPATKAHSDSEQAEEHPQASTKETPAKQKTAHAKTDLEGISVDDAGLVLLAVYLPPFFKKLGIQLSESSKFSESSITNQPIHHSSFIIHHYKAVHLLHYLATGQEHPEEPMLVLPKILCGMALETPVPQELDLSDEEKHEANHLLEAVVRNWPALKNTSPDGLRAGFLRRAGLVSWSESRESWVLRVERLGQDLLLEKVPWSYSVIKLPWMEGMLAVEW